MLYHETKDMYYVMQRLGHKQIKNTLLYVQLQEALFQDMMHRVRSPNEIGYHIF